MIFSKVLRLISKKPVLSELWTDQKGKDKLLERAEELLDLGYVKGEAEKMA